MVGGASHISEHAASGAGLSRSSLLGRIAIPIFIFCVFRIAFDYWGIAKPATWAVAATVVCEILFIFLRRKVRLHSQAKAFAAAQDNENQRKLEFDKRYEEAKRSGALDRFNEKGET